MKPRFRIDKSVSAVLTAALIIAATAFLFAGSVNGASDMASDYTMFLCDEPWSNQTQFPWEEIFGVDYVPISMLSSLDGIEIRENSFLKNVLISYGDRYLTFDLSNSAMYTSDGGKYVVSTYLLYVSERYIPAGRVCEYLGLKYEKKNGAIRISDASAEKTFNELLLKYNPALADTTALPVTTAQTDTEAPVTTEETDELSERIVCLTFECGDYTESILDILEAYKLKATFFINAYYLETHYDTVRRIITEGHAVGILYEYSGADNYFTNIAETNTLLNELLNIKTRLITTNESGMKTLLAEPETINKAADNGYALSQFNCELKYLAKTGAVYIEGDTEAFIRKNELSILRYPSDENMIYALPDILKFIISHPQIEVKRVSESYTPDV